MDGLMMAVIKTEIAIATLPGKFEIASNLRFVTFDDGYSCIFHW